MDWSENKIARDGGEPEAEGGDAVVPEEEKQSEEQKTEEERRRASRRIGATSLCTDGKYIYGFSVQLKKEDDDGPIVYEKIAVEVYQIADDIEVKEDEKKKQKLTQDGGNATTKVVKYVK